MTEMCSYVHELIQKFCSLLCVAFQQLDSFINKTLSPRVAKARILLS